LRKKADRRGEKNFPDNVVKNTSRTKTITARGKETKEKNNRPKEGKRDGC